MLARRTVRRQLRSLILPVVWIGLVGYFVYHTVQGDRGVIAMLSLRNEVAEARATLGVLRTERHFIEARVDALSPSSLDLDLLEEQVRRILNYSHPDEIVLLPERPRG
ncbi:MAG: septum formation initiator family protein [Azospirillaceae bacterium]